MKQSNKMPARFLPIQNLQLEKWHELAVAPSALAPVASAALPATPCAPAAVAPAVPPVALPGPLHLGLSVPLRTCCEAAQAPVAPWGPASVAAAVPRGGNMGSISSAGCCCSASVVSLSSSHVPRLLTWLWVVPLRLFLRGIELLVHPYAVWPQVQETAWTLLWREDQGRSTVL